MSKHYYVYNTGTAGVDYTLYKPNDAGVHTILAVVSINGGAGIAGVTKNLHTPLGVVTRITEEQYDILKQIDLFKQHVDSRFILVREDESSVDSVVSEMASRDGSAQLTVNDYQKGDGQAKPTDMDKDDI